MQLVRRDPPHDVSTPAPECHPLFNDGDVTLASKDGVLFRVHMHTLRITSGFFRSMFSLPQDGTPTANPGTLYLEEDRHTLESLLRMMCGLPLPTIDDSDALDNLLEAVEKYDTPGPLSIVRLLVMTPTVEIHPLRLFGLACRFGWEAEARHASSQTLSYNLYDESHRAFLQRLPTGSLLQLLDLHRSRREGLRARLNDHPFVSGASAHCVSCQTIIDYHTWRELKYRIILEIDARPLGDTVEDGLQDWPEAMSCWMAKCPKPECLRALYDKMETLRVIKDCIEKLPRTI
ncbi:hypothetical protein CYLTODRAFT_346552 [Cylindrobasidium torrendii FP15055 ss-10]|uniref:BTB domain-containing protein n=1 Tax=Cylindrobasidium torrendii FP15055 ss-10 TaxID=1314674 RepID=A0A0D7BLV6_9AGAR|nr:hypothetical protein CYLTODRAFT_346552 [Cylindrobasidium torrendii FP15055 ss-10]